MGQRAHEVDSDQLPGYWPLVKLLSVANVLCDWIQYFGLEGWPTWLPSGVNLWLIYLDPLDGSS